VVVAVNTVIGLAYYLAWTARLFAPAAPEPGRTGPVPALVAVGLTVAVTLAFSVVPQAVLALAG